MVTTSKQPYLLTICSGKGGVGKSVIAANLAFQLANNNAKVLIIDTDIIFPNLHLIYGIDPNLRLDNWIEKKVTIERIIKPLNQNLSIIAGPINTSNVALINSFSFVDLFHNILLDTNFDYIIVDTNAGISNHLIEATSISDKIAIVVTDEPTSIIDAYALIKILQEYSETRKINLILNNVIDEEDASEITNKINIATQHFLNISIDMLGVVLYDGNIKKSIIKQELLSITTPNSEAVTQIKIIAKAINSIKQKS
jgi:flagellar biosynthesis protein FlhG